MIRKDLPVEKYATKKKKRTYPTNKIDKLEYTVGMERWGADTKLIQNTPKGPVCKIHTAS